MAGLLRSVKTLAKAAGTHTDVVRATLQRLFKMGLVRGQRLPDALGRAWHTVNGWTIRRGWW